MAGTTKTSDPENHVEEVDHNLENQTDEGPETQDFPALFEDETESLSEEDLTGDKETPESEKEAVPPPPEGDEPPKDKPPEEKSEKPEKELEKKEEPAKEELDKDEPDKEKPPSGFVPLAALHEERGKRQYLSQEVDGLRQEILTLKETPKGTKSDGFKVLSDKEFEELLEENPTEAILYDRQLRVHEAGEVRKSDVQRADEAIINESTRAMREAVPQIYDPGSTINDDLTKFAVEQGFDEQYLPVLTDPRTKIIPPGSDEPVLLGNVAVGQVKMLYNLYKRGDNSDRAAIDEEIAAAVKKDRKETTDRVTKEVMAKFNATPSQEYHSLGDIPGSGDEPFDVSKDLSEKQIDDLPEAQRRRYLGG